MARTLSNNFLIKPSIKLTGAQGYLTRMMSYVSTFHGNFLQIKEVLKCYIQYFV